MDAVSSKTLLIIEYEKDVVDLLTLNLRKAGGFVISTASDGPTAADDYLSKTTYSAPAFAPNQNDYASGQC